MKLEFDAGQFIKTLKNMPDQTQAKVYRKILKTALAIHKDAKESIKQVKGSKKATRYNPKRTVVVSPRGQPPNLDRGTLVQSIKVEFDESQSIAVVGTDLEYGKHLEYGSRDGTLGARPWLRPAFLKNVAGLSWKDLK